MKYSLMLLPLLATAAFAQDDVWKSLKKGDRVQITFRSGNMLLGNLTGKPGDPRVPQAATIDFSAATEITLDLSLEYPGLNGTMTVPKKEIKEIRKLQNLDAATMKRIQDEMSRIQAQAAKDDEDRRMREAERDKAKAKERDKALKDEAAKEKDKEKGAKLLKEFEDLQKGKELLKRFPPDKYGAKTLKDAVDMGIRRQPIPVDIQEFVQEETQRLWLLAFNAQKDAQDEPEKKEKTEEKKQ